MLAKLKVKDIREFFLQTKPSLDNGMLEIINASFVADENFIFGEPNHDWHKRELNWYLSQSLNVNDIEREVPKIWKSVATQDGFINSNYGWCIFSNDNFNQYDNVVKTLVDDKNSRQAVMIYNRPSMHIDAKKNGMKDFICTHSVHIFIRNEKLIYIVNMRSNDAIFGYKGDFAWHQWVKNKLLVDLQKTYKYIKQGETYWNVGSLHIYPRHFYLVK